MFQYLSSKPLPLDWCGFAKTGHRLKTVFFARFLEALTGAKKQDTPTKKGRDKPALWQNKKLRSEGVAQAHLDTENLAFFKHGEIVMLADKGIARIEVGNHAVKRCALGQEVGITQ